MIFMLSWVFLIAACSNGHKDGKPDYADNIEISYMSGL